jgi:hypothetical protein
MTEKRLEKMALSVAEFAEVLGISRGLAYQLVNSPDGPQVARVGSRILIPKQRTGLMTRRRLLEVTCRKCGRRLACVLPGARVYCRNCRTWTKAGEV